MSEVIQTGSGVFAVWSQDKEGRLHRSAANTEYELANAWQTAMMSGWKILDVTKSLDVTISVTEQPAGRKVRDILVVAYDSDGNAARAITDSRNKTVGERITRWLDEGLTVRRGVPAEDLADLDDMHIERLDETIDN
jgi:hypothetical protein